MCATRRQRDADIDSRRRLTYQNGMEPVSPTQPKGRAYYTAPWRKARICARLLLLRPEWARRPRYTRLAAALARDPAVTNRLIDQALAQLRARHRPITFAT